jgi:hypothetical protein
VRTVLRHVSEAASGQDDRAEVSAITVGRK